MGQRTRTRTRFFFYEYATTAAGHYDYVQRRRRGLDGVDYALNVSCVCVAWYVAPRCFVPLLRSNGCVSERVCV